MHVQVCTCVGTAYVYAQNMLVSLQSGHNVLSDVNKTSGACKNRKGITENPSPVLSTILELSHGCQKRNIIS